jgi:hypothetical protein
MRALALLLLLPLSAAAQDDTSIPFKAGAKGTIGTAGYKGRSAYLQIGVDWSAKASYADYRFDGSTGTTRTLGLRLAWQGEAFSAGVSGSVVPRNDMYANRSFGLDGAYVLSLLGEDEEGGLEEIEFSGWWTQTRHSQLVPATPVLPQQRDVIVNQHDLGLAIAVTGWDFTVSADASKSHYDQDFTGLPQAALRRPRLAETLSLVNGFPDASASARVDYDGWDAVSPYVSLATTRYKLQPQPASATGGIGAALRWKAATLDLGYELVRVKGSADSKYFTFGGSIRF